MKTLTCKELGGTCDKSISAETWSEMVEAMTKHVMENHPDTAKEMEEMHAKDPEAWGKEMKPKWEAAPLEESGEVKDDETQLPEDNEIAEENMHDNTAKDGEGAEDPDAPRIVEDR